MQDDAFWLERYRQLWAQHRDQQLSTRELVQSVLSVSEHWELDLTQVSGLVDQVTLDLDAILLKGMRAAVNPFANDVTRLRPGLKIHLILVTTYYMLFFKSACSTVRLSLSRS